MTDRRRIGDLVGEDIVQTIARGHHNLEGALVRLVEEGLDDAELVDLPRLGFAAIVDIAVAMGFVPRELRPELQRLHAIRRRFLRHPGSSLDEDEVDELHDALFPGLRDTLDREGWDELDAVGKLGRLYAALDEQLHRFSRYRRDRRRDTD